MTGRKSLRPARRAPCSAQRPCQPGFSAGPVCAELLSSWRRAGSPVRPWGSAWGPRCDGGRAPALRAPGSPRAGARGGWQLCCGDGRPPWTGPVQARTRHPPTTAHSRPSLLCAPSARTRQALGLRTLPLPEEPPATGEGQARRTLVWTQLTAGAWHRGTGRRRTAVTPSGSQPDARIRCRQSLAPKAA